MIQKFIRFSTDFCSLIGSFYHIFCIDTFVLFRSNKFDLFFWQLNFFCLQFKIEARKHFNDFVSVQQKKTKEKKFNESFRHFNFKQLPTSYVGYVICVYITIKMIIIIIIIMSWPKTVHKNIADKFHNTTFNFKNAYIFIIEQEFLILASFRLVLDHFRVWFGLIVFHQTVRMCGDIHVNNIMHKQYSNHSFYLFVGQLFTLYYHPIYFYLYFSLALHLLLLPHTHLYYSASIPLPPSECYCKSKIKCHI